MTTPEDRQNAWTWEGAAHAQLRDAVLHTSASERLKVLEDMLALAEEFGALNRCRQQEEEYWSRLWSRNAD